MGAIVPVPVGGSAVAGAALVALRVGDGGGGASLETLRVTMPPASFLSDAQTAELEGTGGSTLGGTWFVPDSAAAEYYWFSHNDGTEQVGPDPGVLEPSLAGMTGREVPLGSGNHTGVAVATATETVATAAGATVSRSGADLDFSVASAAAATTGGAWASRGGGHGVLGTRDMTSGTSFGLDTTRFMQVAPANLPTAAYRIVGARVFRGATLTNGFRIGIYTGGAGDGLPLGATLVAGTEKVVGDNGARDWAEVHFATPLSVAAGAGTRVWVGMQGSGGGSSIAAENIGNGHARDWYATGTNQVLFITAQATGAGTALPATATVAGSSNSFAIWVQLIIQEAPFYGDGAWRSWVGATAGRNDSNMGDASNMNSIFVRWAWSLPSVAGLRMFSAGVNLAAHSAAQQVRIELWDNVTDVSDPAGETIVHDFGATTGSATGWNDLEVSGGVDIDGGGLYALSLKSNGADLGNTQLAFDGGEHAEYLTPEQWGWGAGAEVGGGGDDESVAETEGEVLLSAGETTMTYDPSVPTASPIAYDSTLQNPGNSGGVHALIGQAGFVLTANP